MTQEELDKIARRYAQDELKDNHASVRLIMDYAQRYKDALRRAKKLYGQGTITECLGWIFPEIKESKDEKNIKDLIDELKCSLRAANCQNDACGGGHEKRIARWISVEDELPEKGDIVIVMQDAYGNIHFTACEFISAMQLCDVTDFHVRSDAYLGITKKAEITLGAVTHWMRIEPPAVLSGLERTEKKWGRIEYGK